jgi:SAM-dependent methyltransferase
MVEQPRRPDALHADQVAFWSGEGGEAWLRNEATVDAVLTGLGAHAVAVAAPRPGEVVVDIGCGTGATTLALARAVAPGGRVLGLDLSSSMAQEATRRAQLTGLAQVRFVASDAATYAFEPGAADLMFSRFGVMFFGDPVSAFAHLRGALRRDGRLVFVCWRAFKENGWAAVPFMAGAALLPPLARPGPDEPGPFSFADPARVTGILTAAGFAEITVDPLDAHATLPGGDLDEAATQIMEVGPLSRALQGVSPEVRARVHGAVREALAPHVSADGIRLPAACWVVRAVNPG